LSTSYDAEQGLGGSMEMRNFPNTGSMSNSSSFHSTHGNGKFGNGSGNTIREVPRGEINDRFKTIVTKSVDFLINVGMYIIL
jgi:hypothetical protein